MEFLNNCLDDNGYPGRSRVSIIRVHTGSDWIAERGKVAQVWFDYLDQIRADKTKPGHSATTRPRLASLCYVLAS
ncbi:MAG: hypothetical protein DRR42_05605 [Gammaproteobacteria bacterium]|nr:MAG: hypothetical protein DRR42_05605 [Gammaproteobacteria bacterium]